MNGGGGDSKWGWKEEEKGRKELQCVGKGEKEGIFMCQCHISEEHATAGEKVA